MDAMSAGLPSTAHDEIAKVRALVLAHLGDRDVGVYLFGSRARGDAHRRSDIDVGYVARSPLEAGVLHRLRDAIDALNLPYQVELVNLAETTEAFRDMALREAIPWKE